MALNSKESSLTTPDDRDITERWVPDQFQEPLSADDFKIAKDVLTHTFPRVDRVYADPGIQMQNFSLFSFMPAKGATPNENGVYGFAKIRGTYSTEAESKQRAEYIIRNVDSYNKIFHCFVGRPFPVTADSKYSAETNEIDIRKQAIETVSENIKSKKDEDIKIMNELKTKEEELLRDVKKEKEDPYDLYITQKVKYAQLAFTYLQHQKKMAEVKDIIIKTRTCVADMDETFPDFRKDYFKKYMEAREASGLKVDSELAEDNFIKFMVEDAPLDF